MIKEKVLIVGPDFFGYNESVQRAFEEKGYDVRVISYLENLIKKRDRILYYILPKFKINLFFNIHKRNVNKIILREYNEFNPNFVFIIKGNIIEKDTLEKMKLSKRILWLMDSIINVRDISKTIEDYDYRFMFERTDVDKLKEKNIKAYFLPMAVDQNNYYSLNKKNREIDVVFIGSLYDGRKEFLEKLSSEFKNYNIKVFGQYLDIKKPITYFKYYVLGFNKIFTNKIVTPNEVNKIYNNSKIAINIHHNQSKYGCNPRVFEILGSKTFQIVDKNNFVTDNFEVKKEIITFEDFDDLKCKIKYYISNEKERNEIVKNGYKKVRKLHTFDNRIFDVMNIIKNNK